MIPMMKFGKLTSGGPVLMKCINAISACERDTSSAPRRINNGKSHLPHMQEAAVGRGHDNSWST